MNHREHRTEPAGDDGFTLVELLVVILIVGILAAIALPAFMKHRDKGADADAKSNARNVVSQLEACFTDDQTFAGCEAELTASPTGLPFGPGIGEVDVTVETATGYEVVAISDAETGGTNHTFTITHNVGGVFAHDCTVAGEGGCPPDGTW